MIALHNNETKGKGEGHPHPSEVIIHISLNHTVAAAQYVPRYISTANCFWAREYAAEESDQRNYWIILFRDRENVSME